MAKAEETSSRTHISLNEAVRRKEQTEEDAWRLQLENGLRKIKGKPLLTSLDELDKEAESAEPEKLPPEEDALLRETGQILVDYLTLTHQVAQVERVQGLTKPAATPKLGPLDEG